MSAVYKCKDGGRDVVGRGTRGKIPCVNRGGVADDSNLKWFPSPTQMTPPSGLAEDYLSQATLYGNVETKPKSNNQMMYIVGGIIVAGIVYFMFIKK